MPRWVMIFIGGLIGAGALAGLLYGVLSHTEPGLLKVCWRDGRAIYDGPCKPKVELQWPKDRLPLRVWMDLPDATQYRASVEGAADLWNRHVGRVFAIVSDSARADVLVIWGARETGDRAGGFTTHWGGPEYATQADVQLQEPSDPHAVMHYAAHELGHALGLAHDEGRNSLMHPGAPSASRDLVLLRPTDVDVKLLKKKYQ